MSQSAGFRVKSTHKFINPSAVDTTTATDDDYMYAISDSADALATVTTNKTSESTESKVKTGSSTGMAIRATVKAMEDFY